MKRPRAEAGRGRLHLLRRAESSDRRLSARMSDQPPVAPRGRGSTSVGGLQKVLPEIAPLNIGRFPIAVDRDALVICRRGGFR